MRGKYINNAGHDVMSPDYKGSYPNKMTNEKIQQLNIREYQLGLKLLELANNVIGGDVGDYGPITEAIKAVQQSLADEQKNGLAQLNELGDDPEDFEDESVYADDIAWLNKIEQSIGNISNRPGAKVQTNKGKQNASPEQIQDLEKEFGTQGDNSDTGTPYQSREDVPESARDLWDIMHNDEAINSMRRGM